MVAGIYPLKRENWPAEGVPAGTTQADFERMYTCYTVNTDAKDENGEIVLRVDEEGFMKVNDAPTGFMVIKRGVFEKMMASYPDLNYISDSDYNREDNGLHYRFFDCMVDPESKRYRGAFADSLQTNVAQAVFAPAGTPMSLDLAAPLASNPRGAE